jgi:hypothetical protein
MWWVSTDERLVVKGNLKDWAGASEVVIFDHEC